MHVMAALPLLYVYLQNICSFRVALSRMATCGYSARSWSFFNITSSTLLTLQENSLFHDGEYFKVGEGRSAITEDKISDDSARLRTMTGIAMELRKEGLYKAEVVLAVGLPFYCQI